MTATNLGAEPTTEAYAERIFSAALGGMEALSIYLGDRLGWYRSLAADGPATSAALAARTAAQERYAREWLEQQAVSGLIAARGDGPDRVYSLTPAAAEVLTDEHSLSYLAPLGRLLAAIGPALPGLLDAYRRGGGVSWEQLGVDAREAQADLNRPWFEHRLAAALRGVPGVHDVLRRPGARIADVGCGGGWSTIALARAYPEASVEGVDVDAASVELARRNAASAGLSDRVGFRLADGVSAGEPATYDGTFAFECIHDMPRPVEVLAAVRRATRGDGVVVVMDEAVADEFTAPGDELERFMYGCSIFICLPDGLSSTPSVGTGTVLRRSTLEGYAREAGFRSTEVLPIEGFGFFRFYLLGQ